jgi:hypothetical protein
MIRPPADEAQLQRMLDQSLLDESHTLELKGELPPGEAANKELAKDLAQFTPDGGTLIIGIEEGNVTTPPSLTPIDLAGLAERIEEVAAKRVDPPLHVRIQTLRPGNRPTRQGPAQPGMAQPAAGHRPHSRPVPGRLLRRERPRRLHQR